MSQITATDFTEITQLIVAARQRALQTVNTAQVGQIISRKIEQAELGDGVVTQLAEHIAKTQPGLRGFTRPNLLRMRQFYEAYRDDEKVSPLVRQLPWTHRGWWKKRTPTCNRSDRGLSVTMYGTFHHCAISSAGRSSICRAIEFSS